MYRGDLVGFLISWYYYYYYYYYWERYYYLFDPTSNTLPNQRATGNGSLISGLLVMTQYLFGFKLIWRLRFMFCIFLSFFFFFSFFFSPQLLTSQLWTVHPCTVHGSHKLHFSTTFSLKIDPIALFKHLKIISL